MSSTNLLPKNATPWERLFSEVVDPAKNLAVMVEGIRIADVNIPPQFLPWLVWERGLGEISPKEFKQFIGADMRLSPVEYAPKPDSTHILGFYMGRNTPERRGYIMDNLVVDAEVG